MNSVLNARSDLSKAHGSKKYCKNLCSWFTNTHDSISDHLLSLSCRAAIRPSPLNRHDAGSCRMLWLLSCGGQSLRRSFYLSQSVLTYIFIKPPWIYCVNWKSVPGIWINCLTNIDLMRFVLFNLLDVTNISEGATVLAASICTDIDRNVLQFPIQNQISMTVGNNLLQPHKVWVYIHQAQESTCIRRRYLCPTLPFEHAKTTRLGLFFAPGS